MTSPKILPVILSGGAGSRLWPLSRQAHPKQLLALVSDKTMVQETALRVQGDMFLPPVFICNADHADAIKVQMAEIGQDLGGIIVEPVGRNTAPCAVIAALAAQDHAERPLVLLLPADHHVKKPNAFVTAVEHAVPAAQNGYLVTFGITPTGPETGYGYIQSGDGLDSHASTVKAFYEKPDVDTAKAYLDRGGFAWNAGIFLFSAETLLSEMNAHASDICTHASAAYSAAVETAGITHLDAKEFGACRGQSIDYAVMEPTDKAAIVPADIGWTDIGSFTALHEELCDGSDLVTQGDVLTHDVQNCLIHTDGPLVAAVGVEGISIIVKDGKILVTRLDQAQDVKKIVEALKTQDRAEDL